jgi:hypothetical protein
MSVRLATPSFSQHSGNIGMPFPLCDAKWGPTFLPNTHITTDHTCKL